MARTISLKEMYDSLLVMHEGKPEILKAKIFGAVGKLRADKIKADDPTLRAMAIKQLFEESKDLLLGSY